MNRKLLSLVVAATIAFMSAYAATSIYATCNLRLGECYKVNPKCPATQGTDCHYEEDLERWSRVTKFYTSYGCEEFTAGSNTPSKDCDIDGDSLNNLCADTMNYTSENDCNNHTGGVSGHIYSGTLCGGSDPC